MQRLPESLKKKIKINDESGCWVWVGSLSNGRFGTVKKDKRSWKASRLVYTLLVGPITEGMYLLHSCDNELCVNPEHLREGTQKDNMSDMYLRGRSRHNPPKGEKHPNAKVTEDIVRAIRKDSRSQKKLGELYGIAQQTVGEIKRLEIWKHVKELE